MQPIFIVINLLRLKFPYEDSGLLQIRGGGLRRFLPFGNEVELVLKSGRFLLNFVKEKIKPEEKNAIFYGLKNIKDFSGIFKKKEEVLPESLDLKI